MLHARCLSALCTSAKHACNGVFHTQKETPLNRQNPVKPQRPHRDVSLAASRNLHSLGSVCSMPWYSMKRTAPPSPTLPPSRRTKHRSSALGPGIAVGRCAQDQRR